MPTIRDDNTRSNERCVLCHDSTLLIEMPIRMAEYYVLPENKHLQGTCSVHLENSLCLSDMYRVHINFVVCWIVCKTFF